MPHLPARRRRLSRVLGCALAAASACLAAPTAALADASTGTTLTTDAGGSPLVNAGQLSPGHVVERCVVVSTPTEYTSADLGMFVTASGALADHLNITIESGAGGSFAGCTGFSGRLMFVGTLNALAAGFDETRPERVGHFATGSSQVTLRLRLSVQDDNAAQGQTTTATFGWLPVAAAVVTPPPTDPPSASDAPTTSADVTVSTSAHPTTPDGNATGIPGPPVQRPSFPPPPVTTPTSAVLPGPGQTTSPAPTATSLAPPVRVPLTDGNGGQSPAAGLPVPGGADPPPSLVDRLANGLATGVANAARTISTAAAPALKGAAVTSLMILPLVLLFLLVQRWFDRRDPKLALAPSYGDPFLGFVDRHRLNPPDRQGEPS
ncbi:MAG: hypothetical protein QOF39_1594 [Frankiales bacterium]|nr:hypothetical protein [Frankiales bacterium]